MKFMFINHFIKIKSCFLISHKQQSNQELCIKVNVFSLVYIINILIFWNILIYISLVLNENLSTNPYFIFYQVRDFMVLVDLPTCKISHICLVFMKIPMEKSTFFKHSGSLADHRGQLLVYVVFCQFLYS